MAAASIARDPAGTLRLVQFTDLHLLGDSAERLRGMDTDATFRAVLAAARRDLAAADLLLLTGDLAEHGEAAAYARLRAHLHALDTDLPTRAIPGNHDHPRRLAAAFPESGPDRCAELALGEWRILLLDSSVPGQSAGRLEARQLAWLEGRLERASERHALVVLHHPPLPIGSAWLDAIALENGPELLACLDRQDPVRGVLFGHIHQAFERRRRGVRHFATPSTCVQFVPRTERVEVDPAMPGWRTLALRPDGRIRTRVRRVAEGQSAAERPTSA
ncbi:MAG: 3',5'-cyclic-AMP phosphodiesterase [Gammaproteobacteria bacterium]|nr:3',5'-cyclic-AMP phosphodiesterase [Gammaproteobacteria bacterium]